jgi:hypothetical protein
MRGSPSRAARDRVRAEVEMTKRRDEGDEAAVLGAYAIGGPGLAGARLLGGLLDEELRDGRGRSRELGPAPIGSDPWLRREITAAIAREPGLDAARVVVEVREAVVTLRGHVREGEAARVERAARTVQGIKVLRVELEVP